ncbi:uncharacterized protein LAJ45_11371 [Morchella importuna]|uniref:uncharacterized protein n=1 Tax=Morchella importuna TaxID=1174673 RepID=UPI001E8EC63E|nr:uncharacterized protein LAJ45_11371 [Morchella importuna]KAH8144603.1 hypothetical protein LAJ45_11371 [Morchella importuna]
MEPTAPKTNDQNQKPEESKDLKKELQEIRELQIKKFEPEPSRPSTPPPPYDPMGEVLDGVLYDIEVNPANGNYNDIDEYRQEVDSFLRLLFRIDRASNAYSKLKYDSHIAIPDDRGEAIVRIKFVLSPHGSTFHSAAEDFCNLMFHQRSGPITRPLTSLERLGFSPLSPIFRQYWTRALYHSCAQLGPGFFTTFPEANTNHRRWPRWAMTVHFLFLELGGVLCFDLVLKSMARAGVQSLSSWEQSDSNQLTVASNAAARYFKRYISDMLSSPVNRQNQLFETEARHYQAQIHSVFTELERLGNYDFMARDTVTICNELYGAIESSCIIFTANQEMYDMLFSAQITGKFTLRSKLLRLGDRLKATAAKKTHKAVNLKVRSSLNISYDVLRAIQILQNREQILNDLETGTRPFTEDQAWWISTVNTGQEIGFDMAMVRSYLLIQRRHLMNNYEEIERLVPGQPLVTV